MKKVRTASKEQIESWLETILSHILLITFTDAAAREMRERLAGAFATKGFLVDAEKIPTMTFNAFDMDLIKRFHKQLDFLNVPTVIDTNPTRVAAKVVPLITGDNKVDGLNYAIPIEMNAGTKGAQGALTIALKVFDLIKHANLDVTEAGVADKVKALIEEAGLSNKVPDQSIACFIDLYATYNEILNKEGLITFADQEPMGLKLLDLNPEYLNSLGFKHVVIDEFQDSNDMNMEFVKRLVACMTDNGGTIESIMVIGDDNQSIYGFRNANPDNMIHFSEKIGKPVTQLLLSQNYRSYEEIIEPANKLVALNVNRINKPLIAAKGKGGKTLIKGYETEEEKIVFTVEEIKRLIEEEKRDYTDIAIITFGKKDLGKYSAALSKADIPWVIMAPVKLIDNSRVRGAMKLCDAFFDPDATQCYFEYLIPLYDGKIYEELTDEEIANEIEALRHSFTNFDSMTPEAQLHQWHEYLEAINIGDDELYQKWLDMVYDEDTKIDPDDPNKSALAKEIEFIQNFKRYGKDTEAKMDQRYEGVTLITAHSSKGLEWPIVFNSISDYDNVMLHKARNVLEVEERRRLLFVSMTRAKELLYVMSEYVAYSNEFTGEVYNQFLSDLYSVTDKSKEFEAEILTMKQNKALREEERRLKRNEDARNKRAEAKMKRESQLTGAKGDGTLTVSGLGMTKRTPYSPDYKGGGKVAGKSTTKTTGKVRQLSDAEKAWYDKVTKDAIQMKMNL